MSDIKYNGRSIVPKVSGGYYQSIDLARYVDNSNCLLTLSGYTKDGSSIKYPKYVSGKHVFTQSGGYTLVGGYESNGSPLSGLLISGDMIDPYPTSYNNLVSEYKASTFDDSSDKEEGKPVGVSDSTVAISWIGDSYKIVYNKYGQSQIITYKRFNNIDNRQLLLVLQAGGGGGMYCNSEQTVVVDRVIYIGSATGGSAGATTYALVRFLATSGNMLITIGGGGARGYIDTNINNTHNYREGGNGRNTVVAINGSTVLTVNGGTGCSYGNTSQVSGAVANSTGFISHSTDNIAKIYVLYSVAGGSSGGRTGATTKVEAPTVSGTYDIGIGQQFHNQSYSKNGGSSKTYDLVTPDQTFHYIGYGGGASSLGKGGDSISSDSSDQTVREGVDGSGGGSICNYVWQGLLNFYKKAYAGQGGAGLLRIYSTT